MRKAIAEIIRDFQNTPARKLTRRHLSVPILPDGINKPLAFVGMRRTGKTFLLHQIMQDLMDNGAEKGRLIYLNFEDDRLAGMAAEQLRLIIDVHSELFPREAVGRRFVFLDEIQAVPGWESFVRRIVDTEDVQICLTGSSSRMFRDGIAASLRGRALTVEVTPFSFAEYLDHLGLSVPALPSSPLIGMLKSRFRDYLAGGGFPETIGLDESLRIMILQEYVSVAIHRDLVERHQIRNPESLKALVRFLLDNAAKLFSVHKAYNLFKSQGRAISKDSMYQFIEYIRDAFLLFPVEMYSASKNQRMANPKKMYAADPGLITAFSWKFSRDPGTLLENAVYCELRRRYAAIHYYKTAAGKEVDFYCTSPNGQGNLFQVSFDIENESTLQRETSALLEAMEELNIGEATLITIDEDRDISGGRGRVHIVPAYAWFLET